MYAVQFHPEVDLTKNGVAIMKKFLYKVGMMLNCYKVMFSRLLCCISRFTITEC